jgi:hypothetical protein
MELMEPLEPLIVLRNQPITPGTNFPNLEIVVSYPGSCRH